MDNSVMIAGLHMILSDLQQSLHSPRHCSAGLIEQWVMGKQWCHRGYQIFG